MKRTCVTLATLCILLTSAWTLAATDKSSSPAQRWYRCNTHTHTNASPHSDANETPDFVVDWYHSHGYQCLVITDHEFITDVSALNQKYGADGSFLVLQGQEITQAIADPSSPYGVRHLHVNGINIDKAIMPIGFPDPAQGTSALQAYQRNLAAIAAEGGLAQVNHPNLMWSVRLGDLLPLSDPFLFEVWNAFPTANNLGGTDDTGKVSPSAESLWDGLLSKGKMVWGVASDDTHEYHHLDDREAPTPGKGWIMVQASSLTVPDIMDALRRGEFYATTGIVLKSYAADERSISIQIAPAHEWSPKVASSARFVTTFVGENGRILLAATGHSPTYHIMGTEGYVRASIIDSDGRRAWTQPIFLDTRKGLNVFAASGKSSRRIQ